MGDVIRVSCWATVKRTLPDGTKEERRCKNDPMEGQRVCRFHGGSTTQARERAGERVIEQEVITTLGKFGVPITEDPKEILLRQLNVAYGNTRVLEQMLQEVDPTDVHDDDPQVRGRSRGLLNLHAEWSERAAQFAALAIKAGIEERMIRATEWQTVALVSAMRDALSAAGLDEDQKGRVLTELSRGMRLLAAG